MAKTYDFDDFCQITEMLRKKEGGCPWDLSQTHQSLKPYMLSETAEAVAAIDLYEQTKDASNLCEELGDMLFQVVIQSQIAQKKVFLRAMMSCRASAKKCPPSSACFRRGEL